MSDKINNEQLSAEELEKLDFAEVRGTEGIKFATYKIGDLELNVAVASGTANACELLTGVQNGTYKVDFIEIMACPGGCVNGGGQPIHDAYTRANVDIRALRAKALYDEDAACAVRKSHESPIVKEIYANYLGEAGGHKAHHLLHTTYEKRKKY